MIQKLRFGVVGCGSMGAHHARTVTELSGHVLAGVVDPHSERRDAVAGANGTRSLSTVAELLAEGIDAAIVATPTVHHHAIAAQLIEAGVHVLVEKPIAGTVEEAQSLVALARARGRILTIGHVERFNPALMALKRAVAARDIRSIAITRAGPFPQRIGDVGIVLDLGVHDIDLIRWMAESEIVTSRAIVSKTHGVHEDTAFLHFETANGVLAAVNTNWLTPFRKRVMEVATKDRFYVCDMLLRTVVEHFDYGADGSFRQRSLFVAQIEPLKSEHLAFAAAIRGEAEVAVSGRDGLRSLEIALGCLGVK